MRTVTQYLTRASRSVREQKVVMLSPEIWKPSESGDSVYRSRSKRICSEKMFCWISPVLIWLSCYWRLWFMCEPVWYKLKVIEASPNSLIYIYFRQLFIYIHIYIYTYIYIYIYSVLSFHNFQAKFLWHYEYRWFKS